MKINPVFIENLKYPLSSTYLQLFQERSAELKVTQSALEVTQSALFEARKNLKEVQAQFEDVRYILTLFV
jgi:hypothetical protein